MDEKRKVDVILHDTHVGIWQDDPNDPTFNREIFGGVIRGMRARGWKVIADPDVLRCFPTLSKAHRLASRGDLRATIRISGRVVDMDFWAETWALQNPNGRRYDFDKLQRLTYLDRLRFELERRRLLDWLGTVATIAEEKRNGTRVGIRRGELTALAYVQRSWAESWHSDKVLGRPVCKTDGNRRSGDGALIERGATVWFTGRDGRIRRGTALYHINNMWFVVAGPYELRNLGSHEIFCHQPVDLRRKLDARKRRDRLEAELTAAIRRMEFRRAEVLRRILFGDEPAFMIWSRKNDAWYRPNRSGYTTDAMSAGRYTRAEAEAEVRRVPHHLSLVGPDGVQVRFDADPRAAA
jgi:hypothetical protein